MTAVEQQAAAAPQQLPDAEEGLAELFAKADNAIDRRRTDNLFKQLDERELTEEEQNIIQQRIDSQRRLFAEYEKRENKRKVKELMEMVPDLPEPAAARALELCNGKEDEAAMRVMDSWSFRRRVLTDVGLYTAEPALPRLKTNRPLLPAAALDGVRLISPSKVGTVFVGRFRGKTGPLPAAPAGVPVAGADPGSPGVQQLLKGRRGQASKAAKGQGRSPSRSLSPAAVAAAEAAAAAEEAAPGPAAGVAEDTAAEEQQEGASAGEEAEEGVVVGGRSLRPRRGRPAALLRRAQEDYKSLLGTDSDEEDPVVDEELTASEEGFSGDEEEDSGSASSSSEEEEDEEEQEEEARAAAAAAAQRAAELYALQQQQQAEEEAAAVSMMVKTVARQVAKLAPYEAVAKLSDLETRRPGAAMACLALLFSTYAPAVAEPIATAWEVQKALEAADAAEEAEALRQSLRQQEQQEQQQRKRQRTQPGSSRSKRSDLAPPGDQGEATEAANGQQQQQPGSSSEGGSRGKQLHSTMGPAAAAGGSGEGMPSTSDASTLSATVTAPHTAALAGQEPGGDTPVSKRSKARPPVAPSTAGLAGAKRSLGMLASNKASTRAISDSGHTCRGRVRQKSHKATEMLELGVLVNHPAWSNAGYIFPLGFKSRVLFRSSVDLNSVCVHVCEVLGEGGECWPGPTFQVTAADRPDEPVSARSCTGCWSQILKRINSVITQRIAAGEDLPPPPRTAIAGPEYFGLNDPNVAEAIESLDPDHTCATYWAGKAERDAALASGKGGRGKKQGGGAAAAGGGSSGGGSSGGGSGRKRGRARAAADAAGAAAEEEGDETGYTGTRWSSIERRERYRKRCQEAGEEPQGLEEEDLLPGVIDPVTLEPVVCPAIAPSGHVMGLATWHAVLAEAPRCPFTKVPLRREQLVVLTVHNIDKYRERIITN